MQDQLKIILQSISSQIYLSFDLWTSLNSLPLLAVVGHWISESAKAVSLLLGLRYVKGQHSGENISQAVLSVIQDFNIQDKVGYLVLDNASNNNTASVEIYQQLGKLISFGKSHQL